MHQRGVATGRPRVLHQSLAAIQERGIAVKKKSAFVCYGLIVFMCLRFQEGCLDH